MTTRSALTAALLLLGGALAGPGIVNPNHEHDPRAFPRPTRRYSMKGSNMMVAAGTREKIKAKKKAAAKSRAKNRSR